MFFNHFLFQRRALFFFFFFFQCTEITIVTIIVTLITIFALFVIAEVQLRELQKETLREKCPYSKFFWSVCFRIQPKCGKVRTRKIPNTDTFHEVELETRKKSKLPN